MDTYSTMGWVALAVFAFLSAFSAAAQEAITPINQARLQRLEEEGMQRAKAIDKLLEQSEVVASALLLLTTLAIIGATAAAGLVVFVYQFDPLATTVALLALVIGLQFAQTIGRALAVRDPKATAHAMERPVDVVKILLSPLVRLSNLATNRLLRALGMKNGRPLSILNEEALYLLIGGHETEPGEADGEHAMIHRIIELEDKTVHEIMSPRIDIVAVPGDATVAEIVDIAEEMGYSRIPVYEENIDNIIGILYVKDLLPLLKGERLGVTARELARPAYFIPESKRIDDLLRELRQNKIHIAIVVDEYGGTAGLVTIEDLLEEIVGEIQDEYDTEEERVQLLSDHEAVFDAGVSIDDVNRLLGLALEADGYDTLGGLVYHQLGKVPETGDQFTVDGLRVTVLSTEGRRIEKVKIEQPQASDGGEPVADEGRRLWRRGESAARAP